MTKIIGLTGGIGSGKTTIGKFFESKGIPVYVADERGRKITESPEVLSRIRALFGDDVFDGHRLDRKKVSEIVFNNADALQKLNKIIHPAVRNDFAKWIGQHSDRPFVVRESAILFESGSYEDCDYIVTVTAPIAERIARVVARDNASEQSVIDRMQNQMSDAERISKSDFVIENTTLQDAEKQATKILKNLSNRQKTD